MKKTLVIDLSTYNPSNRNERINYSQARAGGIDYAILKAINKSNNPDGRFEEHMAGCASAGINILGTYHYSYSDTEAKARTSAKAWIAAVKGRCRKFFLDWEDADVLPKDGRAVGIINAYADEITKAGYEFAIYTGWAWYKSYLSRYKDLLPYDFWIARYYAGYKTFEPSDEVNEAYMPAISHNLSGWQFTSSGRVDGINGAVDLSVWYDGISAGDNAVHEVPIDYNPYKEPAQNVRLGTSGNDANWVLWYLWRFGMLLDDKRVPDSYKIDGIISAENVEMIKRSQEILGTTPDGIVGKITRGLYRKVC